MPLLGSRGGASHRGFGRLNKKPIVAIGFTSSQTWTVTAPFNGAMTVLAIGGGGGAGGQPGPGGAGGGGGSGFKQTSLQTLATGQSLTINI